MSFDNITKESMRAHTHIQKIATDRTKPSRCWLDREKMTGRYGKLEGDVKKWMA